MFRWVNTFTCQHFVIGWNPLWETFSGRPPSFKTTFLSTLCLTFLVKIRPSPHSPSFFSTKSIFFFWGGGEGMFIRDFTLCMRLLLFCFQQLLLLGFPFLPFFFILFFFNLLQWTTPVKIPVIEVFHLLRHTPCWTLSSQLCHTNCLTYFSCFFWTIHG